jgi:hypothetical protein
MPTNLRSVLNTLSTAPVKAGGQYNPWTELGQLAPGRTGYFHASARWYRSGVALGLEDRQAVVAVWRARPDLRRVLGWLVEYYPCVEFKRPFCRSAEREDRGDYGAWFHLFPDLQAHLHSFILRRARMFNQGFVAADACLLLARHYGSGDEAWRMLACAIKRSDCREQNRRPSDFLPPEFRSERDKQRAGQSWLRSEYLRHDLETHGRITAEEAGQINCFLLELDAEPLMHWC